MLAIPFALALAACVQTAQQPAAPVADPRIASMYAPIQDGDIFIEGLDTTKIDPRYVRQVVNYSTQHPPGTVVVDPHARFLYLVMENGQAMRYGVGVAKAGLELQGETTISRKARWPGWTPTPNMIKREPERYGPYAAGLKGGIDNPMGARALYLYQNGQDTLYRIHGTTEPWTIGQSVSSGCIRLFNHDIIDLHSRVPQGSRAVILGPEESTRGAV